MEKQFKFPDIGEGITEGEIVKWQVEEGDEVKEDQTLAEIETDKAVVEIPSPYSGKILKRHFKEKEIIKVGETLVTISGIEENGSEEPLKEPLHEKETLAPSVIGEIRESRKEIREILATPKVRKLAVELGVDIKNLKGSGPQERITELDIRETAQTDPPKTIEKKAIIIKSKFDFYGTLERIPLRGVRRATAKRMSEAIANAAHVTHFDEADLTEIVKLRKQMKSEAVEKNIKLTYLPFIVKAVVAALKLHPYLNATLDIQEEEIILKKYYNIGIAVDIPDGLIVPVVKMADQKTLFMLAEEIQNLAVAAKARTLDLADLKGGTFSITNAGAIGGEYATPIINYPEVAILGTLRIADRVRVVNGKIKILKTLPLCLSFDHKVIDGAEAARFMNDLIGSLESPGNLLSSESS